MSLLNAKRLVLYPGFFLAIFLIFYILLILTGSGLTDRQGFPIGRDFSHYWTASTLALAGEAAAVYDVQRLEAARAQVFGRSRVRLPWLYPPTFLLMILPLALMPYLASLAVFQLTTLAGYLWVIFRTAPHRSTVILTLAFPGTLQNIIFGQNGFLSGALLGGGLLLLDRFPRAAGFMLGLFTYKPHFAILIPVALIAGRCWQALLAMVISALGLAIASVLVLGPEVWLAFEQNISFATKLLQSTTLHWHNRPTLYSAVMLLNVGLRAAWTFQGGAMLLATGSVAWVWHRKAPPAVRYSVLVLSLLFFTPYAAVYDLTLLALPLAWLGWEGYTQGWQTGEQNLLIIGWLTPLITPVMAKATGLQVAPLIIATLLICTLMQKSKNPCCPPPRLK